MAENSQKLAKISEWPRREAEDILTHVFGCSRAWLLAHSEKIVTSDKLQVTSSLIKRRLKGEPLAYILGEQEFYGLSFKVNKHVLIPRPETEKIIDLICHPLNVIPAQAGISPTIIKSRDSRLRENDNCVIIDVGTGSGAIIISMAKNLKNNNTKFFAIDISAQALAVAKHNAKLNAVDKKIKFLKGDLLTPLFNFKKSNSRIRSRHEVLHSSRLLSELTQNDRLIIVANLPYLKNSLPGLTKAQKHDLSFEPRFALFSGPDGLNHYRRLAKQVKQLTKLYPQLNLEIYLEADPKQMPALKKMFTDFKTKIIKDYRSKNRFLLIANF